MEDDVTNSGSAGPAPLFERLRSLHREGIEVSYLKGLSRDQKAPVVFVLDLHDETGRRVSERVQGAGPTQRALDQCEPGYRPVALIVLPMADAARLVGEFWPRAIANGGLDWALMASQFRVIVFAEGQIAMGSCPKPE